MDREVAAIGDQFRTFFNTRVDQAKDTFFRGGGDDRAIVDIFASGVGADFQLFDARYQLFNKAVGGFVTDRNGNRDRHAAFASSTVASADQCVSGFVQICVGHDQHVVLRTTEALGTFAVRGRAAIDVLRDRGRTNEANGLDDLVVQQRVYGFFVAVHNLQNAIGKTGLFQQFCQIERRRRAAFGRFQDHRVARGKRRSHFPQRDHRGEVEGGDACDNAQRLTNRVQINTWATVAHVFALQHVRGAHADFDNFQTTLNVAACVGQGFTVLARDQLCQLVHVLVDQGCEFHHDAGAALRVGCTPSDLSFGGLFDDRVDFIFGGQRYACLNLARSGVEYIGETARRTGDEFAIYVVFELFHFALHCKIERNLDLRKYKMNRKYGK